MQDGRSWPFVDSGHRVVLEKELSVTLDQGHVSGNVVPQVCFSYIVFP